MHYDQLTWFAAEAPRFAMQLGKTLLSLPERKHLPEGDGHPVVVLPGLWCSNGSTYFFRKALNDRGHNTLKWCNGANMGITEDLINDIVHQVSDLAWEYQQPVSLVGQSLGGSISRVVANMIPHEIRSVITLGSPINGLTDVLDNVKVMYDLRNIGQVNADHAWQTYYAMIVDNPPVPCTSIYSKTDGVVGWKESIQAETDISENVEVFSSHLTMGFDLNVINVIADRLAQPEGKWSKYNG
jgi:pimeloyl-ACP methyl ester carboxylesterase